MRTISFIIYLLTACFLVISSCNKRAESKEKEVITIAAAANMQFAIQALADSFAKEHRLEYNLVISSSGKLTAQIKEGAPYDIFVSANMKYPKEIDSIGKAATTPKVYAYGKLVLWSMMENISPSIEALTGNKVNHIALANPATAPYGKAATESLEKTELTEKVKGKLVFGESIAQTNQFITSKSAELGFTALSVVLSPEMKGKGKWTQVPDSLYTPLEQGVIIVKQDKTVRPEVLRFYQYLFSTDAKKILKAFGYAVNESTIRTHH
ncbi:molybdate ABC transporter substrate-binding protein [Limibacter armeniacum]|uniref:molybdate ABC transporter substrate-binding protein n=1 Tax=Limibacter armeniacum TaxID=466084 RepID=UPI002FE533A8